MKPVLLSLGPVHVYSFGVLVALGVLISLYGMVRDARESGILSRDAVYDLLFVTLLAGFAGGRLFYIVQNLEWYSRHPLDVFALWEGGLIFYGGLMGGLIGLAVFCRWKRVPYIAALDFMAPYLALSHAFGRVGCFLNGCCVGSACELPWAVHFPGDLISRHPAQLYEAFLNVGIFLFLRNRAKKPQAKGEITLLYLILYAIVRFVIEFIRDGNPYWGLLTFNQWISCAIILGAGIALFFIRRSKAAK